ncbi:MAG: hypothetical protein Q4E52_02605 [Fibrobacter sp.]|nr:hypothetical protein [Fibrobacter sp.]
MMTQYDIDCCIDDAINEGLKKGIEQGIEQGLEKGHADGIQVMRSLGVSEDKIEEAKKMLEMFADK